MKKYNVLYYSEFLKNFVNRIITQNELNFLKNNNFYILEIKEV